MRKARSCGIFEYKRFRAQHSRHHSNRGKNKVNIIAMAISGDSRIENNKKISKYQSLKIEIQRLWRNLAVIVPVGISAKTLDWHLKHLNIDQITICQIQITCPVWSTHIIRKYFLS